MKKVLLLLFIQSALSSLVAAQKVEVNASGFFIKNKPVTKETTPAQLRELLGPPDTSFALTNIIWTYNKRGFYIYLNPADSSLKHITFNLVKHDQKFSPVRLFNGVFILYKNTLSRYTTLKKLMKMKSLRFEENPLHLNPAYTQNVKIFFEFDDAKKILRSIGVALVFRTGKPD